jgi:succinate-semialdehyde dehydrogenase / glutarate-semialdehyde dehydrogenase
MSYITSINPTTGKPLGKVEVSSEKEIIEKVALAQKTKKFWAETPVSQRVTYLKDIYDVFSSHKEEIAELVTREIGMPKSVRNAIEMDPGLEYFHWYLENAEKYLAPEVSYEDDKSIHKVFYQPTGVAAVFSPWNFPFCNFSWALIPNLIAGNTVVFKHSEECPLVSKLLEDLIQKTTLPKGVLSFVYGDGKTGDFLVHQNIDMICFTGSSKVGQYLYKVAAEKGIKALLELGGSAPGIVCEDADINAVVESVFFNRFLNSGQICDGLKRLIVHKSRFDEVVSVLKEFLSKKIVGEPTDNKTDIGPLVAERQLKLLEEQVGDAVEKGAKIIFGGKRPDNLKGYYYLPTVLTNIKPDMRVWNEEVFGPALPIVSFDTDEEAIRLANDTKYGLGGYVFTKNKEKAEKIALKIDTGMVAMNSASYLFPSDPFGGNKNSGIGREHGKWGLRELCKIKVVAEEK